MRLSTTEVMIVRQSVSSTHCSFFKSGLLAAVSQSESRDVWAIYKRFDAMQLQKKH